MNSNILKEALKEGYIKLTSDITGVDLDIWIDTSNSFSKHSHEFWIVLSNDIGYLSLSKKFGILDGDVTKFPENELIKVKEFIDKFKTILYDIAHRKCCPEVLYDILTEYDWKKLSYKELITACIKTKERYSARNHYMQFDFNTNLFAAIPRCTEGQLNLNEHLMSLEPDVIVRHLQHLYSSDIKIKEYAPGGNKLRGVIVEVPVGCLNSEMKSEKFIQDLDKMMWSETNYVYAFVKFPWDIMEEVDFFPSL